MSTGEDEWRGKQLAKPDSKTGQSEDKAKAEESQIDFSR